MLQFNQVTYQYKNKKQIFKEFSWLMPSGRTVLLGPNGAGKSTLLGLAANLLTPQSGSIRWDKFDPSNRQHKATYRQAVGWMPQHIYAVPGLRVREQLAYAGWLKGLTDKEAQQRLEQTLEQVDLLPLINQKADTLSGGQLRRLGLAQVLIHQPKLLLLDEPTVGLDPGQRAKFRQLLTSLPSTLPVVVSTHQTDDLGELFDQVVVLYQGKILFEGSVEQFLAIPQTDAIEKRAELAYTQLIAQEL